MNKDILFRILEQWHEEDQFQKIIDTIHDLPEEELDYDLKSHLARALNNNDEMEEAYIKVSYRISHEIVDLSKRQRKDASEYAQYINNLNIPDGEKERQQKKIKDSLNIKIGRNMSGYSLANALFNCISPKRTPYKALADYMKRRQEYRTGVVIRDYLVKKRQR